MQVPQAESQKESLISSDTLPEFAELEAEYAAAMAGIEAEEKPKKGRKKKGDTEQIESVEIPIKEELLDPDEIEDICAFPFDSYYIRKGKEKLSTIERKALARSIAKVVNKWAPKIGGRWKEEIGLFICLTAIMGSRYEKPEEKKEEKKDEKKEVVNVQESDNSGVRP